MNPLYLHSPECPMVELKFAGRSKKSQGVLFYFPLQEEKEKGKKKTTFSLWQASFEPLQILLTYRFIPCGGLFRVYIKDGYTYLMQEHL